MAGPVIHAVVLLGRSGLLRDLLHQFLSSHPDLRVQQVSEIDAIDREAPELILLLVESLSKVSVRDHVEALRRRFPKSAVAIVTSLENRTAVKEALQSGGRGIIPTSITIRSLMPAIHVLLAGESFIPFSLADTLDAPSAPIPSSGAIALRGVPTPAGLSLRERQVLALLCSGMSNRAIGAALSVQENTVKVHVRNLLRKLNARNRFQLMAAAINGTDGSNGKSR